MFVCALNAVALFACGGMAASRAASEYGRLTARRHPPGSPCEPGLQKLGVNAPRDALLYVPAAARATWPLLVLLHGAGSAPDRIVERFRRAADSHGVILLAPASHGATWDGIRGRPGRDVEAIDEAVKAAFDRCAIESRIAIGGFSDGASYALTLGIANGDLFSHVLAFSPCLLSPSVTPRGRPLVFISHGRRDEILPFSACGEALATRLQEESYSVRFEPFAGPHTVPDEIADLAFTWFIGGGTKGQPKR